MGKISLSLSLPFFSQENNKNHERERKKEKGGGRKAVVIEGQNLSRKRTVQIPLSAVAQ